MRVPRSSGVQLHPTSLPGGTLDRDAYAWIDWLAAAGQSWWQMLPLGPPDRYGSPYKAKSAFAAWPGLLGAPRARVTRAEELDFRERHAFWIEDWIRHGGAGEDAVADQVRFEREWSALREYAAQRGVGLIGDVPIYVAPRSADHKAHPELFQAGVQAGTPPDAYAQTGQLWGNPLYDWPALRASGYRWWIERLRHETGRFDLLRIDHFRGFVAYWRVSQDAKTAVGGRWVRGPGRAVFDAAQAELGALPLIAEDLGVITDSVEALRQTLRLPSMAVLQFGFNPRDPRNVHDLANHTTDRIAYTSTHDNDTLRSWYESAPAQTRELVDAAIARYDDAEAWWRLIRLTWSSKARVAMTQAQDVLGLGNEARMNEPGTKGKSWRWRASRGAFTAEHAERLRAATEESRRLVA